MAEKILNTRITQKYDTISNWNSSSLVLKSGEIAIAEIPSNTSGSGLTPPAIGIKVGDGTHTFSELNWIQAVAGDVNSWAKAASKPSYTASEISAEVTANDGKTVASRLSALESNSESGNSDVYRILTGTSTDANKWFLQKKAYGADDSTYTTVSTIDLSSLISDAAAKGVITTIDDDSNSGTYNGTSTDLPTTAAVVTYVTTKIAGLSGAMHFRGSSAAIPPESGTYAAGDVVLKTSTNKEYVYDGTNWIELGDEGSYALKTITVTGGDGLTGGGALSENRTITHDIPSGASTSNSIASNAGKIVTGLTFDKFGHATAISSVDRATIASTGNINDLVQTSGDVLVLNCGSSTTVI